MGVVLRRSATELPCSNAARICCFTARCSSEVIVIDIICLLSSARHREKPCPQCNRRAYRCLLTHFCPWPNTLLLHKTANSIYPYPKLNHLFPYPRHLYLLPKCSQ